LKKKRKTRRFQDQNVKNKVVFGGPLYVNVSPIASPFHDSPYKPNPGSLTIINRISLYTTSQLNTTKFPTPINLSSPLNREIKLLLLLSPCSMSFSKHRRMLHPLSCNLFTSGIALIPLSVMAMMLTPHFHNSHVTLFPTTCTFHH